MAGDLHDHIAAAGIPHPGEELLKLQTLRGRPLRWDGLVTDQVAHGAHQPHLYAQSPLQQGFEQQRHRSLSIGSGNADDVHGLRRPTIEIAGHFRQSQPFVFYQHIGNVFLRLHGGDHRPGSLLQCHWNEPVAVGGKAGDGNKEAAWADLAGIIGDGGDIRLQVLLALQNRHILQQLFQFHVDSPFSIGVLPFSLRQGTAEYLPGWPPR